jgi:hypothetical protein
MLCLVEPYTTYSHTALTPMVQTRQLPLLPLRAHAAAHPSHFGAAHPHHTNKAQLKMTERADALLHEDLCRCEDVCPADGTRVDRTLFAVMLSPHL